MKKIIITMLFALMMALPLASMAAININTASAAAMADGLPGIGPAKASAIVDYRKEYGPFKAVDDLTKVPGIGDGILSNIRGLITVGDSNPSSNDDNSTSGG
jgi:competence protein ComEA